MLPLRLPLVAATLAALAAALSEVRAAPLDAEACARLKVEQGQLEDAGVEKDMAKGAEWAKSNLGLEKLQRVQRFIEIEEQLLFRCRSKTIVSLHKDRDDDKDDDDKDDDDKDAAPKPEAGQAKEADPKLKQQPAAAKPRKPEPAKSPKASAREPAQPGVTSIEKRPPKAKVDDAYKAPPPDPSVNPFAGQVAPGK
jgi:hypothetical protein